MGDGPRHCSGTAITGIYNNRWNRGPWIRYPGLGQKGT